MMSAEAFWTGVGVYNETMWPVAIVMTIAAAFLTHRVFLRPGARTDLWMKAFLSLAFAWNGVVFFLIFVKNPISTFTGTPLFVIVSLLFAVDILTKKTHFKPPKATWKKGLTVFWVVLVFLYPLPTFPCPLTTFAIALVAAAAPNVDKKVFVLLLPWALMGLPKCFGALDCYEDCILFASGVYGLVELIRNWKPQQAEAREDPWMQREVTGQRRVA
jgi:hypothetical protein